MKKFTEEQTKKFYNTEDAVYRSFWDKDGNCHYGYFSSDNVAFDKAMVALNNKMLTFSTINNTSTVLDLGCGNGNNSFFIHERKHAKVTGIDLSDIRIRNAMEVLITKCKSTKNKMAFFQSSAERLKFKANSFSHVWSQACIYHIHNKIKAFKEVYRVIKKGGIFILDDLIKPNRTISCQAEKLIYERLLFNTKYNLVLYQQALEKIGFRILYAEDMSRHYALSYWKLADILEGKIQRKEERQYHAIYKKLIYAYRKTWKFMEKGEIGWALFVCRKV